MTGGTALMSAPNGMATEDTPFIRNAWYVACFSDDLPSGKPIGVRALNNALVLWRTADGGVQVARDRCPHRSFPLSKSMLDGDDLVCGYHGIRYGPDGSCRQVPTQERPAGAMRLVKYVAREASPLVWVWLGDPALADATPLPDCSWALDAAGWATSRGEVDLRSNYVFLHENLMDLSHLTFLHAKTFGTPDYASAPFSVEVEAEKIHVRRTVSPTRLPPIYADPLGIHGPAARIVTSTYHAPGLSVSAVVLQDLSLPEERRVDHHIRTAQIITPVDRERCAYRYIVARDFAVDDADATDFIHRSITSAFGEDVDALESMAALRESEQDADFREYSIGSDKAGVLLRRKLQALAGAEVAGS